MSIKFKDLPLGAKLALGRELNNVNEQEMKFFKISHDGRCRSCTEFGGFSPDAPRRGSGKNRDERTSGTYFYPDSYLHQFLNSDKAVWAERKHDVDAIPGYARHPGFLSWFTPGERKVLKQMTFDYPTPSGYVKDKGPNTVVTCLAAIPSMDEMLRRGQYANDWFTPERTAWTTTRTSDGKHYKHFDGRIWSRRAGDWTVAHVEICVDDEAEFDEVEERVKVGYNAYRMEKHFVLKTRDDGKFTLLELIGG